MSLEDILSSNSGRRQRRRVGRGLGSGLGKTCGRGQKGEGSRTGGKNRGPLFEGGQFPYWMRLPKRGFSNRTHSVRFQVVSLSDVLSLNILNISIKHLVDAGLAHCGDLVKVVGKCVVDKPLQIEVHRVSASVRQAVEAAGGKVVETFASGQE